MTYRDRLFQSNQSKFYQKLDANSHEQNIIPDKEKTREFWFGIWEKDVKDNGNADWIQKVTEEMRGDKQHNIEITSTKIKERIRKMANWKALVPDGVHGYWIKMLVSMHERVAFHRQSCRTVLLFKDKSKGNEVSNYRPIVYLPLMRNCLQAF